MIAIGYITIFLVNILLAHKKFGKYLNIIFLFTGVWCFFGALSSFGMYGLRIPGLQVHVCAWIFIQTTDIILLLFCKKIKPNKRFDDKNRQDNQMLVNRTTCASFIQIIAIVFYIPVLANSLKILLTSGFDAVRDAYFNSGSNALFAVLCKFMPTGFIYGLMVYYVYKAFETRKWKYLLYSLINATVLMIGNGGRYALFEVLLASLVAYSLNNSSVKKVEITKNNYFVKRVKRVLFATVSLMVCITIFRGQNLFKSTVGYFSGSFSFLDLIFENADWFELNDRLYGYLTFGAITEPVVLLLKVLGLTTAKTPSYMFNIKCQEFYNIGNESTVAYFNNNTSVLYYFIRDFGAWGIVIGAIFLAAIIVLCYNRLIRGNRFYTLIYIYLSVVLLNTIMTYQLFQCTPFFSVVAMYFCVKPTRFKFSLLKAS